MHARRTLLLLLLLPASTAIGCHDAQRHAEAPPSPRVELEGAHLVERAHGQRVWELEAKNAVYRNGERIATLDHVSTRFYEDGALVSSGTAPQATFHLGDRRLELRHVTLESTRTHTGFTASAATWLPGPGKLRAQGPVAFWRGDYRLDAGGLVADRALRQVQLASGVTGAGPSIDWAPAPLESSS
ncbi:MAG TPA: LPS export ABC transporter periplasmic protein LptC [Oscillatoriaceae cyanobacterium]